MKVLREKQAGKKRLSRTPIGNVTAPQGDVQPPTDGSLPFLMGLLPSAGSTKHPAEEPPPSIPSQQSKKRHKTDANKGGVLAAMSPVSGAASKLRPNKSKPVIEARKEGRRLSWIDQEMMLKGPSRSEMYRMAESVESMLCLLTGVMSTAADVLFMVLSKPVLAPL
jgi:hypothetical protein